MMKESVDEGNDLGEFIATDGKSEGERACKNESSTTELLGFTPSGEAFRLPKTSNVVTQLLKPKRRRSVFTWVTVISGSAVFFLSALGYISGRGLLIYTLFWRLAYNVGLGWILYKQSSCNWIVNNASKLGLGKLEKKHKRNILARFLVKQIEHSVNESFEGRYNYDSLPLEYNVWILVRHLINLILVNDFTSYIAFALCYLELPKNGVTAFDVLMYIAGFLLVMINLWVKTDAHRVLKDYAWYWGDFFFTIESNLSFDGVLELAPHPMYSLGYVGLYGASLISRSYYVLFVSIVMHISQLLFLTIVETPHMKKVYEPEGKEVSPKVLKVLNEYFGEDNLNLWKPNLKSEVSLLCCFLYLQTFILSSVIDRPSDGGGLRALLVLVGQAAFWFTLRSFGTGYVLSRQSKSNSWVNFFSRKGKTESEAFKYWRVLYDIIHNQSYIAFFVCCWKLMDFDQIYTSKTFISRVVIGVTLCFLQVWSTKSAINDILISGWYYGDFFSKKLILSDEPIYTGIYRYVDNPMMYLTSLWGVSLIVNSSFVYFLVAYAQMGLWLVTQYVERPHLRKVYGSRVRSVPGVQRVILKEISKVQVYTKEMALETVAGAIEVTSPIMSKTALRYRRINSPVNLRFKGK